MSIFPDPKTKSRGFTLVELLVSVGLFSIVLAVASAGFVNALRTQRQVASLISAESNVTLVLEQMAREERTGYLFCHDYGTNNAQAQGSPSDACGACVVSDSGVPAGQGTPSEDIYRSTGDLAVWTCPAIDYYTSDNHEVTYSLQDGALMKADSGASSDAPVAITGNDVSVKYLSFTMFGNLEGDHWTPRITIAIGVAPSSTDAALSSDVLHFETTVSAREVDCGPSEGC